MIDGNPKRKHSKSYLKKREAFLNKPGVRESLEAIAATGEFSVQQLIDLIGAESGFNTKASNKDSKATGLIQFMPSTAKGMGTTIDKLSKMNEVEQLKVVAKYFKKMHKKGTHPYITVAYPKAGRYEPDKIIATKNSKIARQNPGWVNADGNVTRRSIEAFVSDDEPTPLVKDEISKKNDGTIRTPGNIDKVMSNITAKQSSIQDGFFENVYSEISNILGGVKERLNLSTDAEHFANKVAPKSMINSFEKTYEEFGSASEQLDIDSTILKDEEPVQKADGGYIQPNGRKSTFSRDEDLKAQSNTFAKGGYMEGPGDPPDKVSKHRNDVQSFFEKHSGGDMDNFSFSTPNTQATSEEGNCIHGVCDLINQATGNMSKNYEGNETFRENMNKEGYYDVPLDDLNELHPSDIITYEKYKKDVSRYDKIVKDNPEKGWELVPAHSSMILSNYKDALGNKSVLGNNMGGEKMRSRSTDLAEIRKYKEEGFNRYATVSVLRYNPDKAKNDSTLSKKAKAILEGDNEHADKYNKGSQLTSNAHAGRNYETGEKDSFFDMSMVDSDEALTVFKAFKENYDEIGKTSNVPPRVLNMLMEKQLGISAKESGLGSHPKYNLKEPIPDGIINAMRPYRSEEEGRSWYDDYYNNNVDDIQSKVGSADALRKLVIKEEGLTKSKWEETRDKNKKVSASSGIFQQKELSQRGHILNGSLDIGDTKGQAMASIGLAIDNYHAMKNRYPEASEEELVDLTTLMHSRPAAAMSKRYINHYMKNDDPDIQSDYVSKVNKFTNNILKN